MTEFLLDSSDVIMNSGYTKPIFTAKVSDIPEIKQVVTLHCSILEVLAELDQFKKGLQSLGVLDIISQYPKLMAPFFTNKGHQKLSAGKSGSYVNNSLLRFISDVFKVFRKGEKCFLLN